MRTQTDSGRRVALVTGATDGIGRATARRLAGEGWRVIVVGRNPARCAEVEAELRAAGGEVEVGLADLSVMAQVAALADEVCARHDRLDALVLNANTITHERRLTVDGFEPNLAVGLLGRVLLQRRLEPLLLAAPGGQVLTVVGLDHQRLDLEDPHLARGWSARAALMRWQWAVQVLAREDNRRGGPPVNVFMPGLVKTKILADEPQPMRALVQLANLLVGIPVERSAGEVVTVLERVAAEHLRDVYFARTRLAPARNLRSTETDGPALHTWCAEVLRPWLGGAGSAA